MTAPLEGIRVVDLTRILAGPFATMILGDMGADVIKVERPGRGDETRAWGPPFHGGVATYYLAVNRNKRSLSLDLRSTRGREILWELLEDADVLVSNFRAGAMARLGLAVEQVRERCPRLVYAHLNGYGAQGPRAARPTFDLVIQAEAGLMDLTGDADGPPTKAGLSLADEIAGLYLVQGILAALLRRQRSGRGEPVEVALHDAMLSMLTYHAQGYLSASAVPRRMGNSHPSLVPYRPFATADGHIVVGVASEALWERFCAAVDMPGLFADPRFRSNAERVRHREELERLLEQRLAGSDTATWRRRLDEAGVPCGAVRSAVEALESPETESRQMIVRMPDTGLRMLGMPIRMPGVPTLRRSPPTVGEHTVEILQELGHDAEQIARLRDQGVV